MARKITNLEQMLDRFDRAADRGGGSFAGRGCKSDRQQIVRSLIAHGGSCSVLTTERNPWDGHNHGGVDTADRRPDDAPPRILLVAALAAGRSIARTKFCKAIAWLRRPARCIDRWVHPRLVFFIEVFSKYM